MYFCLRIDLDYVPWDNPDATEFGHGEPAMVLRLLDLARNMGYKYHFFASNRTLRAFPSSAEAVLNDGHDLDWLCKHPADAEARYRECKTLFSLIGHVARGMAVKTSWPEDAARFEGTEELEFLSAQPGYEPAGMRFFPVETRSFRAGLRGGQTTKAWSDATKLFLREAASRNKGVTVVVRPQVLAKYDPRLATIREILDLSQVAGLRMATLRDLMKSPV